jgi:CheY-like chemotaxis protein
MEGKMNIENKQRILVLDDQPEIIELIELIVESNYRNCTIDTTISGKEALDLCDKNEYNLICADYIMPGLNGDEFVHNLRVGQSANKNTPVIIITGNELELGDKMDAYENVRVINKIEQVQHVLEIFSQYLKK